MKYSDLATRLEELDRELLSTEKAQKKNQAHIRSLERQLDTARDKALMLIEEHQITLQAKQTCRRELEARLR